MREPDDVCKAGLTMTELPVQRLVMILPPDEQPPELMQGLAGFPPMPRGGPRGAPQGLEAAPQEERQAPRPALEPAVVVVEQPQPQAEMVDLPMPQRAPRPRGRPRRAQ